MKMYCVVNVLSNQPAKDFSDHVGFVGAETDVPKSCVTAATGLPPFETNVMVYSFTIHLG